MSVGTPLFLILWFHPLLAHCSQQSHCFEKNSFSSFSFLTSTSSPSFLIDPCPHCVSHFSPSSSLMIFPGAFYAKKHLDWTISASVFAILSSSLTLAGPQSRRLPLSSLPHRIYIPVTVSDNFIISADVRSQQAMWLCRSHFLCLALFLWLPFAIVLNQFTGLNRKSSPCFCCLTSAFLL